jgi:hypothetical protein
MKQATLIWNSLCFLIPAKTETLITYGSMKMVVPHQTQPSVVQRTTLRISECQCQLGYIIWTTSILLNVVRHFARQSRETPEMAIEC